MEPSFGWGNNIEHGEKKSDPKGFETFMKEEFGYGSRWAKDLSDSKKQLIFTYKKQFERIKNKISAASR